MSGEANQWETVARYKKARKLANVLIASGAVSAIALDSDTVRAAAVALTGVKAPSDVTWELTRYLVEEAAA